MVTTAVLPLLAALLLLVATAPARLSSISPPQHTTLTIPLLVTLTPIPSPARTEAPHLTLIVTSASYDNRLPDQFVNFDSNLEESQESAMMVSSDLPLKYYTSVSSSICDQTRDIMSVIGDLLFAIGCGALTAALMYFVWAIFSPRCFNYDEVSSEYDGGKMLNGVVGAIAARARISRRRREGGGVCCGEEQVHRGGSRVWRMQGITAEWAR